MTTIPLAASEGPVVSRHSQMGPSEWNGQCGSPTGLEAAILLVGALGLVSSRYDWRDVAAGLVMAVGGGHGRHFGGW